jgi:phosphoglycolate phosphatase
VRIVLFDCDGTLVDSQVMIVSAMTSAFAAAGLAPPPREEILSIVGLSLPIAIDRLAARHPEAPVDALVEAYKTAFQTLRSSTMHQEPLYPGAREAIDALAAGPDTVLGVVTGKSRRGLEAILARHGLRDRFQVLKTADDAPSKPHPAMVLDAVAELGGAVERTVVVGDTSFDMEMAAAAGALPLGVSWGYHPRGALVAAGAVAVVDRFDAVPDAVAAALGRRSRHA